MVSLLRDLARGGFCAQEIVDQLEKALLNTRTDGADVVSSPAQASCQAAQYCAGFHGRREEVQIRRQRALA